MTSQAFSAEDLRSAASFCDQCCRAIEVEAGDVPIVRHSLNSVYIDLSIARNTLNNAAIEIERYLAHQQPLPASPQSPEAQ